MLLIILHQKYLQQTSNSFQLQIKETLKNKEYYAKKFKD